MYKEQIVWEVMLGYLSCVLTVGEAVRKVSMELHSITIQLIELSPKLKSYCVVSIGIHLLTFRPIDGRCV